MVRVLSVWTPKTITSSERTFCGPLLPQRDPFPCGHHITLWVMHGMTFHSANWESKGSCVCQLWAPGRADCVELEGPMRA